MDIGKNNIGADVMFEMLQAAATEANKDKQRIELLEQMIYKFCIAQTWTTQQWKDQPCVAPLFAVAKEVKARE